MPEHLGYYLGVLLVLCVVGVWCCSVCARRLGVHDHPGIVWDEIVGYARSGRLGGKGLKAPSGYGQPAVAQAGCKTY